MIYLLMSLAIILTICIYLLIEIKMDYVAWTKSYARLKAKYPDANL